MGSKFNPFTGNIDFVGESNGGTVPNEISSVAGEALSALKFVYQDNNISYVASSNMDHRPVGIVKTAALLNDPITIVTFGEFSDSSFLFAANETLFLNIDGSITTTPPSSGYVVELGFGLGSGKIFINIKQQIII